MRVRIHRGAAQVGGTCVELESAGKRILLDLGMPLDADEGAVPLPEVPGLAGDDPSLVGVVISHLHGDHCGLVPYAAPELPLAVGPVHARILPEAEFFTGRASLPEPPPPDAPPRLACRCRCDNPQLLREDRVHHACPRCLGRRSSPVRLYGDVLGGAG